ncbi:MAG: bifunctional demethylmenaquinone methyltransferase/2-methoxy-6-polyprenyl-1,4-benzoquinol methylase UbiE [Pseudomonadota bacterium]
MADATKGASKEGTASFGYRTVDVDEKQDLVDDVFHSVARRYDIMNDLMSAGIHRLWKDAMVSVAGLPRQGATLDHLDVAGGTGDIAFRVRERAKGTVRSTVLDINASMLAVGRERAEKRGFSDINFVEGNAEELPFESSSFDTYTIAFGIRNVPRIDAALSEAYRVLRRGGRFLCLEFSSADVPGFDKIYDAYSFNVIPVIGQLVTGDQDSYRYLVESIRKFPKPERFKAMIERAGFSEVSFRSYSGGAVVLHIGWKI